MTKHESIILEISQCLSDHLSNFIIIANDKEDKPANKTAKTTYRDYNNFNMNPL